jgi:hypothetical protein
MDKGKNKTRIILGMVFIIIFSIIAGWIGFPEKVIDKIIYLVTSTLIIGTITSAVTAEYVEYFTGDRLKEEYFLIRNIFGLDISISVFSLIVIILGLIIF